MGDPPPAAFTCVALPTGRAFHYFAGRCSTHRETQEVWVVCSVISSLTDQAVISIVFSDVLKSVPERVRAIVLALLPGKRHPGHVTITHGEK